MLSDSLIPGFPELVGYEPKCKLCQLATDAPGLLKVTHRKSDEGLGSKALISHLRAMFERHGIKPPSVSAFTRHFSKHVDFKAPGCDTDDFDLPDPMALLLDRMDEEASDLLNRRPDAIAYGHNDSDYHNLAELFRRLMRRIVALDDDPTAFINNGHHSFNNLSTWAGMIRDARGIIESLNKMRSSDAMRKNILEYHTKQYATAVVMPLAAELRTLRDEMRELAQTSHEAHRLELRMSELLDYQLGEVFTKAAASSLAETEEHYKLMN